MMTVKALCSAMETSDRHLTPRGARDWWTKGLLPRPHRRRLGRGKGTETCWARVDVLRQAQEAYDVLAHHARTDIALLHLWLMGFPIDLRAVRAVYLELNDRHLREIREQAGKLPEDVIGDLAGKLARRQVSKEGAPVEARDGYAALTIEFLSVFYGNDSELMIDGLAEQWEKAVPYVDGAGSQVGGLADLHPTDETLTLWSSRLKQYVALPAQRAAIESASDYELMRARRLMRFVLEYLRRFGNAAGGKDACAGFTFLHMTGRLLPILVAVLREDAIRQTIMFSLLEALMRLPPEAEWPALVRRAGETKALKDSSTVH